MSTTFEPIVWTDAMTTGVAEIDRQHRYLVDMLAEANAKLVDDHDTALMTRVVRDLLGYALLHFETEENLMSRYGYGDARPFELRAHIDQHRAFSRQVVEVADALRERRSVSRLEVLAFLNNWLRDHVLGIDRVLAAFVREAEVAEHVGAE